MPIPRPDQPPTPSPEAFTIHRAAVADDMTLGYKAMAAKEDANFEGK